MMGFGKVRSFIFISINMKFDESENSRFSKSHTSKSGKSEKSGKRLPAHVRELRDKQREKLQRNRHKPNYHDHQFVKAARQAIEHWLSWSDWDLVVISAQLRPGGTVLEVLLSQEGLTVERLQAIEARKPELEMPLRHAIASELNRKRTPHVRIRLVPMGDVA
jgi:hypothetical protein